MFLDWSSSSANCPYQNPLLPFQPPPALREKRRGQCRTQTSASLGPPTTSSSPKQGVPRFQSVATPVHSNSWKSPSAMRSASLEAKLERRRPLWRVGRILVHIFGEEDPTSPVETPSLFLGDETLLNNQLSVSRLLWPSTARGTKPLEQVPPRPTSVKGCSRCSPP